MNYIEKRNALQNEIKTLTDEQLDSRLAMRLKSEAEGILETALILQEKKARGQEVSELKSNLLPIYALIAAGQLDPGLVVRFAGDARRLKVLGSLPIDRQEYYANGGRVQLAVYSKTGALSHRMCDPINMESREFRQAFDVGSERNIEQQRNWVDRQNKKLAEPAPKRVGKIGLDPEADQLYIPIRGWRPASEIEDALKALRKAQRRYESVGASSGN